MVDAATKYIPKPKGEKRGPGGASSELNHGTFTTIAYATAWIVAIVGTVIGAVLILQSFQPSGYGRSVSPNFGALFTGIATIASSWIGASGVGTLAEISRKLTKPES